MDSTRQPNETEALRGGAMITREYCQLMARYNRWVNERLYALVSEFPAGERDRDAFFGSMHGTLNHLLWGDRMWLGRFIDEPCEETAHAGQGFLRFARGCAWS